MATIKEILYEDRYDLQSGSTAVWVSEKNNNELKSALTLVQEDISKNSTDPLSTDYDYAIDIHSPDDVVVSFMAKDITFIFSDEYTLTEKRGFWNLETSQNGKSIFSDYTNPYNYFIIKLVKLKDEPEEFLNKRGVVKFWNKTKEKLNEIYSELSSDLSDLSSDLSDLSSDLISGLATKLDLSGGDLTGDLTVNGNNVLDTGNFSDYAVPYERKTGDIDLYGVMEIPLNGFITSGSKEIRFFVPWAKACPGTYTMKELSITVRHVDGGYPWARSGSSGGTYTRLGDGVVQIWNNGSTARTNEVQSITVTAADGAGLRVNITFTEALVPSNGSTTAITNNVPISISKRSMIVTRS